MDDLNQVLRVRREKLRELRERGVEPFAYNFEPSTTSREAIAAFHAAEEGGSLGEEGDGDHVTLGGRIVGWRDMGRSVFAHLEDGAGRI